MIGELLLAGGWLVAGGMAIRGHQARAAEPRETERSSADCVCGCGHHLSFHVSAEDGGCQQTLVVYADVAGVKNVQIATDLVQCRCVRYVGPEPIAEYLP